MVHLLDIGSPAAWQGMVGMAPRGTAVWLDLDRAETRNIVLVRQAPAQYGWGRRYWMVGGTRELGMGFDSKHFCAVHWHGGRVEHVADTQDLRGRWAVAHNHCCSPGAVHTRG